MKCPFELYFLFDSGKCLCTFSGIYTFLPHNNFLGTFIPPELLKYILRSPKHPRNQKEKDENGKLVSISSVRGKKSVCLIKTPRFRIKLGVFIIIKGYYYVIPILPRVQTRLKVYPVEWYTVGTF